MPQKVLEVQPPQILEIFGVSPTLKLATWLAELSVLLTRQLRITMPSKVRRSVILIRVFY